MKLGVFVAFAALAAACAGSGEKPASVPAPASRPAEEHEPQPPTAIPEPSPAEAEAPDEEHDEPDDGAEDEVASDDPGEQRTHPLDSWSADKVADAVARDLPSLGSMSLGSPSAGLLINGRQAEKSTLYEPVSPGSAWATEETLAYLDAALRRVHAENPGTLALSLGDISAQSGGPIAPHVSHQSGRDVDIGYFYKNDTRWYRRGTAQNLDIPRNWAFVRALVTETDVELILIDNSIQALLREHALASGEDPAWVDGIFRGRGGERPLIRHARGHATHIHVRFYNPLAQETARRSYSALVARGVVPPVQSFVQHKAKKGDTLGKLSKRYGVSVVAIKRANRLKSSLIREKRTYLIPIARPRPAPEPRRLAFPPRRLPPERLTGGPNAARVGTLR
ncbi:MAG TPA: penicillin-insensitive murein endopeptidase [Polyangiaceae bacterium]